MNENLSNALNEVRDEYIEAAADLRSRTTVKWAWAAAVMLALVLAAGALAHGLYEPVVSLEQPSTSPTVTTPQPTVQPTEPTVQPTQPITPPTGGAKIYWARGATDYSPAAKPGEVAIDKNLETAMELSTNPEDLFAVSLEESTGVSKEVLYKEIVLPIGAKETFMEEGVVYLSEEQIGNLECPEGMSIVLKLCYKADVTVVADGKVLVSENYFSALPMETVDLWIYFQPDDLGCEARMHAESCLFDPYKYEFLEDYGISEESWDYFWHRNKHEVILRDIDAEIAGKLLNDSRITDMWHVYSLDLPLNAEDYESVYWEPKN